MKNDPRSYDRNFCNCVKRLHSAVVPPRDQILSPCLHHAFFLLPMMTDMEDKELLHLVIVIVLSAGREGTVTGPDVTNATIKQHNRLKLNAMDPLVAITSLVVVRQA